MDGWVGCMDESHSCASTKDDNGDRSRPSTERRFAKLVSELLVEDLCESLYFWGEALGFEIAYQRPKDKFAYLERPEGAQIMLCERSEGRWETAPMEKHTDVV